MGTLTPATDAPPANYSELFEDYFEYVKALVSKFGVQDDEDAASTILLKFYEKDFLSKFQTDAEFDTPRGRRKSSFRGFLSGFVSLYVRQERDKQMTRLNKEPIRLEQPAGEDTVWIEIHGPAYLIEDQIERIDFPQEARRALEHLKTLPIRGTRDLPRLFTMMAQQVMEDGRSNRKAIAKAFGVSETAICLAIADLREVLRGIGFAPGMV